AQGRQPGRCGARGGGYEAAARGRRRSSAPADRPGRAVMNISAHYWLIAFVFALALHALAGSAVWLARNAAPATDHAPRGVMVSLDALSAGNSAQISTDALTPVQPVTAASPAPQTGATAPTAA